MLANILANIPDLLADWYVAMTLGCAAWLLWELFTKQEGRS